MASQEAMGDYSKPNLPSSESESELKTGGGAADGYYDDWAQSPYRNYSYGYEVGLLYYLHLRFYTSQQLLVLKRNILR